MRKRIAGCGPPLILLLGVISMVWKNFRNGLAFGAGFALALFSIGYVFVGVIFSAKFSYDDQPAEFPLPAESLFESVKEPEIPFFDLSVEEQIATSTVVANIVYSPGPENSMRAVVEEILKIDDGTIFYFEVGDEYPSMNYFPAKNRRRGDGAIVFFQGSPATMKASVSYEGERIGGFGDMPLSLLKEKCAEVDDDA